MAQCAATLGSDYTDAIELCVEDVGMSRWKGQRV